MERTDGPRVVSERPDWDSYFMKMASVVAERSTCLRRSVGAVAVLDRRILATGYNGAPTGVPHCAEVGCLREARGIPSGQRQELCRGLHAEQNVIVQAALHGVTMRGATVYCTHQPCVLCAKMLINAGIVRIVYRGDYPDSLAMEILRQAGVEVCRLSD
ncbi:MAG: cytidine/deoxycytidylate deaminase family protein [Bacillota bacterium]|jgi:dCMP deaminase|nr:cytidine deaminase [Bacillota bacterium]HOB90378.1 cytidine/deoxycytidylate deaminase family protein [Bacillota bacterium]HPZ53882.1 cytidine/deoxycytidylate deaminase family protein [Bacillota bacterium]HQD17391.1 cytidine/deoxycytidylate deaminase family protein [Bacillota bacterium]